MPTRRHRPSELLGSWLTSLLLCALSHSMPKHASGSTTAARSAAIGATGSREVQSRANRVERVMATTSSTLASWTMSLVQADLSTSLVWGIQLRTFISVEGFSARITLIRGGDCSPSSVVRRAVASGASASNECDATCGMREELHNERRIMYTVHRGTTTR